MRWVLLFMFICQVSFADESLHSVFEKRRAWLEDRGIISASLIHPEFLNALILSDSPYLLSHALQPVNWHEWQSNFETEFGQSDRLIFISIGYDTCHWCHVMAQESFSSVDVAEELNAHYFSIKIDREQWPLVDNRFRSMLEQLQGEAGWPINIILTPSGRLIWADTYLDEAKFLKVVSTLAKRWQHQPETVNMLAENIAQQLSQSRIPAQHTKIDWPIMLTMQHNLALQQLVAEQTKAGPRFLREYWLLGLLDNYFQQPNPNTLAAVEQHIDSILMSPSYDAIDGGFHRYAVDDNWQQPHFEKMLYTQAFMIRVLARLFAISGKQQYLRALIQTIDWTEQQLKQPFGYASAMSAVSLEGEGAYYHFPQELSADINRAGLKYYPNRLVAISSLSQDWRAPIEHLKLQHYRASKIKPSIDGKVIVSWNAMYINALIDAYHVTAELQYLTLAQTLADELWVHARVDNKLSRIIFDGKASIAAQWEDYSWFAIAELRLSFYQPWLQHSAGIEALTQKSAKSRGLWLLSNLSDDYTFKKMTELARDGEVPSVYSSLYQAMNLGYELTGQAKFKEITTELKALHSDNVNDIFANYSFINQLGVSAPKPLLGPQFFAKGNGKLSLEHDSGALNIVIDLAPGWHVNAHLVNNDKLIPTQVFTFSGVDNALIYPAAIERKLSFSQEKLALYEGLFIIKWPHFMQDSTRNTVTSRFGVVRILLQACSEHSCLLPEELQLWAL
ncbi:thioredoxin domain-containing protein [Shewanella baltica]|uniref:thioredoxin domain-containing protein n=1 Tax=Shewanella baltica TaxID=62322 RepID=UPI003D79C65D